MFDVDKPDANIGTITSGSGPALDVPALDVPALDVPVLDPGPSVAASPGGVFTFYRPDGTPLHASPTLPDSGGTIETCHDADITPDTIVPAWYGERLDLDYAIHASFADATYQARQPSDQPGRLVGARS